MGIICPDAANVTEQHKRALLVLHLPQCLPLIILMVCDLQVQFPYGWTRQSQELLYAFLWSLIKCIIIKLSCTLLISSSGSPSFPDLTRSYFLFSQFVGFSVPSIHKTQWFFNTVTSSCFSHHSSKKFHVKLLVYNRGDACTRGVWIKTSPMFAVLKMIKVPADEKKKELCYHRVPSVFVHLK